MNGKRVDPQQPQRVHDGPPQLNVRLLPLVLIGILAATALSVDASRPAVGPGLWRAGLDDVLLNVLLYVPLGVVLSRYGVTKCGLAGAALSITIETIQLFYPDRFTGVSDVVANTAGAVIGCAVAGTPWVRSRWRPDVLALKRGVGVFALVVCVVFTGLVSFPRRPSDFRNWDPECRLSLGDELTADRTWKGEMSGVAILPVSLDSRTIRNLASAADTLTPDLEHEAVFTRRFSGDFDRFRGKPMLDSREAERFFDVLTGSGTLTILMWGRTDNLTQVGPARFVSYSKSIWKQDFALGQEDRDIVFRILTPVSGPGGYTPELETNGVLKASRDMFVAATYDGRNARVYLDGRMVGRLNLRARGRTWPFLADSGLPASAVFIGMTLALGAIGLLRGGRRRRVLIGVVSGLAGGLVFVLIGGADALPEFAPWIPLFSLASGFGTGLSTRRSTGPTRRPPNRPAAPSG